MYNLSPQIAPFCEQSTIPLPADFFTKKQSFQNLPFDRRGGGVAFPFASKLSSFP